MLDFVLSVLLMESIFPPPPRVLPLTSHATFPQTLISTGTTVWGEVECITSRHYMAVHLENNGHFYYTFKCKNYFPQKITLYIYIYISIKSHDWLVCFTAC